MLGLAKTVNASDLEVSVFGVVRLRTSQIFALAVKRAETLSPALLLRN
jgi:hypothetical protein